MFCFKKESAWPKDFTPSFLFCGIDNAGKSTVVSRICSDSSDPIPTVGFVPHDVKMNGKSIKLYDVGGGERIRGIWSSYYPEVYGVIYVIDATDVQRLTETTSTLSVIMADEYLTKKPILVLANKQDTNGALDSDQITEKLNLASYPHVLVSDCSAIQHPIDKNIKTGLGWMFKYITDNIDELVEKVSRDLIAVENQKKKDKILRQERIRVAREERAKNEAENTSVDKESDDGDLVCSPFKPVKSIPSETSTHRTSPKISDQRRTETLSPVSKSRKKKGRKNKIAPMEFTDGSQTSLASTMSDDSHIVTSLSDRKLAPVAPKSLLPKISSDYIGLKKSSLPPIQMSEEKPDDSDSSVQKSHLSDMVHDKRCKTDEFYTPGIFQNKYVNTNLLSHKPTMDMNTVHSIKIDRSKFIESFAVS